MNTIKINIFVLTSFSLEKKETHKYMHSKLYPNLILECENLFGMSVIKFVNKN